MSFPINYLDFPLDKGVGIWVAVDAEEEEPLALFVVAVVGVKNLFVVERFFVFNFVKKKWRENEREKKNRKNLIRIIKKI